MCREIIYFCAELLNYWSMTFFGLKLFIQVYETRDSNKIIKNNMFLAILCIPISYLGVINYNNIS